MDEGDRVNLKVYVRVRPVLGREEGAVDVVGRGVRVRGDAVREFDAVFGAKSEQCEVFDKVVGRRGIEQVAQGYHSTVFLYGQTGSGKTYTAGVSCRENLTPTCGIMPRCIHEVFSLIAADTQHEYKVSLEWIQTYQDTVQDLLSDDTSSLQIRECPDNGVFLVGSRSVELSKPSDFASLSKRAEKSRVTALTRMNAQSSRSHSCLIVTVSKRRTLTENDHVTGRLARHITKGKLCIVDLAGSERLKKSLSEGIRREEAKAINSSLAALGNVLQSLVEKARHVPYRDSKLTRLLQDSLGGSGFASFIVTVSPSAESIFESKNSLQFAERAKLVKNAPRVHLEYDCSARFAEIQSALENRIQILEARNRTLEAALEAKKDRSDSDSETEQSSAAKLREVYKMLREREYELEVMRSKQLDMETTHTDSRKLMDKLAARDSLIVSLRKQVKTPGEVDALMAKICALEDALATSKMESNELSAKLKTLQDKQALLQSERDTANKTRKGLDSVIVDLRKRLSQEEAEHHAVLTKLRSKDTSAQGQCDSVTRKYNSLKSEMQDYREAAERTTHEDKEAISQLQSALDSIGDAHKAATREMESVHRQSITDLKRKYTAREAQMSKELEAQTTSLLAHRESAGCEVYELNAKLQHEKTQRAALEAGLAAKQGAYDTLHATVEALTEREEEAQALVSSLQRVVLEEQSKQQTVQEEVRTLTRRLHKEEQRSRSLVQELESVSQHGKEMQEHSSEVQEQLDYEKAKYQARKKKEHLLQSKFEAERTEHEATQQQVRSLEEAVNRAQEDVVLQMARIAELEKEAECSRVQRSSAELQVAKEMEHLKKINKQVDSERAQLGDEVVVLQEKCREGDEYKSEASQLKAQVREQEASHKRSITQLEASMASLQAEGNKLRVEHNQKLSEVEELFKHKEQQLSATQGKLQVQTEGERQAFEAQRQTYNEVKHNLLKQISELTARLHQYEAEKLQKDEQVVRVEEELLQVIRKSKELEAMHTVKLARHEEEKDAWEEELKQETYFLQQQTALSNSEGEARLRIALRATELHECWVALRSSLVETSSALRTARGECLSLSEKVATLEAQEAAHGRSAKASGQEVSILRGKCTVLEETLAQAYDELRETVRGFNSKVDAQDARVLQLQKDMSEKDAHAMTLTLTNQKLAEDTEVRAGAMSELQHRLSTTEVDLQAAKNSVTNLETKAKRLQHALDKGAEDTKAARMLGCTFKETMLKDRKTHQSELSSLKEVLAAHQQKVTDYVFAVEEAELQVSVYKRKAATSEGEVVDMERRLTESIVERDRLQRMVYALRQEINEGDTNTERSETALLCKQLEAELQRVNEVLQSKAGLVEARAEGERAIAAQLTTAELRVSSLECSLRVSTATIETLRSELAEVHALLHEQKEQAPPQIDDLQVARLQQQAFMGDAVGALARVELEEAAASSAILSSFSSLKRSVLGSIEYKVKELTAREKSLRVALVEEKDRYAGLQGDAANTSVLLKKTLREVAAKTHAVTEQQNTVSKLREDAIKLQAEKDDWQVKHQHQTELLSLERNDFRYRTSQLCADKQQELAAIQADHVRMVQLLKDGVRPDGLSKKELRESILRKSVRVNEANSRSKILLKAKQELILLLAGKVEKCDVSTQAEPSVTGVATQCAAAVAWCGTQTVQASTLVGCRGEQASQTEEPEVEAKVKVGDFGSPAVKGSNNAGAQTVSNGSDAEAQAVSDTSDAGAQTSSHKADAGTQMPRVVLQGVSLSQIIACVPRVSVSAQTVPLVTATLTSAATRDMGLQCAPQEVQDPAVETPLPPVTPEHHVVSTPPTVAARRYSVLRELDSNSLKHTPAKVYKEHNEVLRLREQVTALKHMQVETLFIADAQLKRERLQHSKRMASLELRSPSTVAATQT